MREVVDCDVRRGFCRSSDATSTTGCACCCCCCCFNQHEASAATNAWNKDSSGSEEGAVMEVSSECCDEVSDHTEVDDVEADAAREEL